MTQPKRAKRWRVEQRQFQQWLALPSWLRVPLTQRMLAQELHIDEATLSDWKHIDGWDEAVNAIVMASMPRELPEIMGSFLAEARKGSYQHQKTYFEMIGAYTPKQEVDGDIHLRVIYDTGNNAGNTTEQEAAGDS